MTITPETIAELRGLLAEAPPLPYRYQEKAYGDPSNGPEYVALEAQHEGRWEKVAVADYDKWGGMGLALAAAAVNALPDLMDAVAERDILQFGIDYLKDERDALAAAVARVRALHHIKGRESWAAPRCRHCREMYPCPVIRALEGTNP